MSSPSGTASSVAGEPIAQVLGQVAYMFQLDHAVVDPHQAVGDERSHELDGEEGVACCRGQRQRQVRPWTAAEAPLDEELELVAVEWAERETQPAGRSGLAQPAQAGAGRMGAAPW